MPGLMRREPREEGSDVFGRFERLFEEWMRMMPFRPVPFSHWREAGDFIRVEEFREDETLVIRADLASTPRRTPRVTVSDGMLRIEAERRAGEEREEEGYLRQEVHYGSLSRSLPLPAGVTEAGITAAYRDGVLEIRIPAPRHEEAMKVAISRP